MKIFLLPLLAVPFYGFYLLGQNVKEKKHDNFFDHGVLMYSNSLDVRDITTMNFLSSSGDSYTIETTPFKIKKIIKEEK